MMLFHYKNAVVDSHFSYIHLQAVPNTRQNSHCLILISYSVPKAETKLVKFLHIPKEQSKTAYNKEAYLWRNRKTQSLAWFLVNQFTEWCWNQMTYPQTVDLRVSMNAPPQPLPLPTLSTFAHQDNHGLLKTSPPQNTYIQLHESPTAQLQILQHTYQMTTDVQRATRPNFYSTTLQQ